jgi:hypothetical protein
VSQANHASESRMGLECFMQLMKKLTVTTIFAVALVLAFPLSAQPIPVDSEVVHPYQRVTVPGLAAVSAKDTSSAAITKAALATVLSASKLKCDPDSPIESVAEANAGASLQTLASKISGASCVVNGRRLRVQANFVPNGAIQGNNIIASIKASKPLLFEWKGALYVLYGVVYDEHLHYSGRQDNVIRQFLLIDPRYSDKRRLVSFEREKDNFAEVEGVAGVSVSQ